MFLQFYLFPDENHQYRHHDRNNNILFSQSIKRQNEKNSNHAAEWSFMIVFLLFLTLQYDNHLNFVNHPSWQVRLRPADSRSYWSSGTNGYSDVQHASSHFNFRIAEVGANETIFVEAGIDGGDVDKVSLDKIVVGEDGADKTVVDEVVLEEAVVGETGAEIVCGSNDGISSHNSNSSWISFDIDDDILTEREFPSKLLLIFRFLFWKKDMIWLCLADIGIQKEKWYLNI
jgi:hypothetical protein